MTRPKSGPSWQEQIFLLDENLVGARITADEYRRERDRVLGSPGAGSADPDLVRAVTISADGRYAVVVGRHRTMVLSRLDAGPPQRNVFDIGGNVVVLSDDGGRVYVGGPEGLLTLGLTRGEIIENSPFAGNVAAAAVDPTGEVGLVNADGVIMKWQPEHNNQFVKETGHRNGLWSVAFGPKGVLACFADPVGELALFSSGETEGYGLGGLVSTVSALTMTPDGRFLIIGAEDGTILVRDRQTRGFIPIGRGHRGTVCALATSPDGEYAASGGEDGSVQVWRIDSEDPVTRLDLSKKPIRAVAVARHATRIVAADAGGVVYLGHPFAAPTDSRPPADASTQVPRVTAFRILGGRTVVGRSDGSVQMFDPGTPDLAQVHAVFDQPVRDVAAVTIAGESFVVVSSEDHNRLFTPGGWIDVNVKAIAKRPVEATSRAKHILIDDRLMVVQPVGGKLGIADTGDGGSGLDYFGVHPEFSILECARVDGRPTGFTGGRDGRVRVWDLLDRELTDTIEIGRPVWRIEVVRGHLLLVGAGGELVAFEHVSAVRR